MIRQTPFILETKEYNHYLGFDEAGEFIDYIEQVALDEATGQSVRFFPDETLIKRDTSKGKGGLAYILTSYIKSLLDNNGNPILATGEQKRMITNKIDEKSFLSWYGIPIAMSGANGFVRGILGYDKMPIYNTNPQHPEGLPVGAALTYSTEQQSAAPTYQYHPVPVLATPTEEPANENPDIVNP